MSKKLSYGKIIASALLLTGLAGSAFATEKSFADKSTYVGGLIGESFANGNSQSSSNMNFGLTVGTRVSPDLGLGIYGTYYGQSDSASVFGRPVGATSLRTYNICGEMNFFASVFHLGGDAGLGISSWEGSIGQNSVGSSRTSFIFGPEAGFDIPLGTSALSLGGEVHYLFTNDSEGQNNLQALAALKVWL